MEQARKRLKTSSIVVLILGGLTLLNILFEVFFGNLNDAVSPEGASATILLIVKILVLAVSLVLFLPQLYIGIKGLKMAKAPDSSKGHIVWGIILIVLGFVGLISPLTALIQGNGDALGNTSELLSIVVDITVLIEYVSAARAVRNGL